MKVHELIELLQEQNPDDIVIMSKDSGGNNYSPLSDLSEDVYAPETSYYGGVFIRKLTPGLRLQGYTEEDLCHSDDKQDCVTLWPTN